MNTQQVIELAAKHLATPCVMGASAQLCYHDAVKMLASGQQSAARLWAVKSLAYSVGIFHPDYMAATNIEVAA